MREKNYWPHFIIGLVLFAVMMGVWTVKTAIDNPVELDNSYMMKYQEVDKDIYAIQKQQREFNKHYKIKMLTKKLQKGPSQVRFIIEDKDGHPVENADVTVLFTRPDTTKYDKKTKALFRDGIYSARANLPLEGRWNVIIKTDIGKLSAYKQYKLSTRRIIKQNPHA